MNYSILILATAFLNFMVGLVLLYFLARNIRVVRELSNDKYEHLDRYLGDLLERIQRIEKNHPVQAVASFEDCIPEQSGCDTNRIKSTMEELHCGNDPDEIRREYGYSGSEMGLILAAAGLGGNGAKDT